MKKIATFFTVFIVFFGQAQIQHGGVPPSFNKSFLSSDIPVERMPAIDVERLKQQDAVFDQQKDIPWRFGEKFSVNLHIENSGNWEELPNGDRVWRLKIQSEGAQTINFIFNQFKLPVGAQLFIYNDSKTDVRGAFTYKNNLPHGGLGTDLIVGDLITLELYEPKEVQGKTKLQIGHVVHGYRSLNYLKNLEKTVDIGKSGPCNINVVCPIANNWRDEIRSIGLMIRNGTAFCTGALINNTCEDGTPLFLTADHCVNTNQVGSYVIRFNFESTTCNNNSGPYITNQSISGTTLRALNAGSDFCLLELSSAPPLDYNVFYAGWDRNTAPPQNSVGIHHPRGDLKKFSVDDNPATTSSFSGATTWRVGNWEQGTTESGSSGSPLFNQNRKIVGQLYGGSASCSSITEDQYGKFDVSWNAGSSASSRLREWLDPCNTNTVVLNGADFNIPTLDNDAEISIVSPNFIDECSSSAPQIVRIRNKGSNTLTNVSFSYEFNGNINIYNWSGNLSFNQSEDIVFDDLVLSTGNNVYEVSILSSNLLVDENLDNNQASTSFNIVAGVEVRVEIQTNFRGNENSFAIINEAGSLVEFEDGFGDDVFLSFNYCLPCGNYTFEIYDSGNNGMTPTFFFDEGYYNLFANGVFVSEGSDFGGLDVVNFVLPCPNSIKNINQIELNVYPNPTDGILNINHNSNEKINLNIYNSIGQLMLKKSDINKTEQLNVTNFATGLYLLNFETQNTQFTEKLIVK